MATNAGLVTYLNQWIRFYRSSAIFVSYFVSYNGTTTSIQLRNPFRWLNFQCLLIGFYYNMKHPLCCRETRQSSGPPGGITFSTACRRGRSSGFRSSTHWSSWFLCLGWLQWFCCVLSIETLLDTTWRVWWVVYCYSKTPLVLIVFKVRYLRLISLTELFSSLYSI